MEPWIVQLGVTIVSVLVAVYGAVRATTREHVDDATKQTNILSDIKTAQAVQNVQLGDILSDVKETRADVKAQSLAISNVREQLDQVKRLAEHAERGAKAAHKRLDAIDAPSKYQLEDDEA